MRAQFEIRDFLALLAYLVPFLQPSREPSFPAHYLGPRALVEEIVHADHAFHGCDVGVCVAFAQHGVVHLLGGGVLPERAVAFGDRGSLAVEREVDGLGGGAFVGEFREHVVEGVEAREEALLWGWGGAVFGGNVGTGASGCLVFGDDGRDGFLVHGAFWLGGC